MGSIVISPLGAVPEFGAVVTHRIWAAWSESEGFTFEELKRDLACNLNGPGIPFTLVAHDGDAFLGTVSVIDDDLPVRPAIWPWLASLWVEPDARARGIGARLIHESLTRAAAYAPALHLHATADVAPFYEARGWTAVEHEVNGVTIFRRPTRAPEAVS
ncbi:GNAT family N-acetyltransferase [Rhizobium sp. YIM 134829]|uniref:GNAT family N-acetyltransferase n=1 Tax=Rhizobium sp. YIM 134829 TaxID=3390453 RepID=UPI00397C9363